jgi:hypothetical protein
MNIKLHIERLILQGLPVNTHEGRHIGAAVQAELTRLLSASGIAMEFQSGGAFESVPARPARLGKSSPRLIGQGIARSIHGSLGRER